MITRFEKRDSEVAKRHYGCSGCGTSVTKGSRYIYVTRRIVGGPFSGLAECHLYHEPCAAADEALAQLRHIAATGEGAERGKANRAILAIGSECFLVVRPRAALQRRRERRELAIAAQRRRLVREAEAAGA